MPDDDTKLVEMDPEDAKFKEEMKRVRERRFAQRQAATMNHAQATAPVAMSEEPETVEPPPEAQEELGGAAASASDARPMRIEKPAMAQSIQAPYAPSRGDGDGDDLLGTYFLLAAASKRATVARLIIPHPPSGSGAAVPEPTKLGTGFLIGPSLLMTNRHVLTKWLSTIAVAEFDYVSLPGSKSLRVHRHRLNPRKFFVTSPPPPQPGSGKSWTSKMALDYAVVHIEPLSTEGVPLLPRGYSQLREPATEPRQPDRVNIIQYPGGRHQKIAMRQNGVIPCSSRDHLHYLADTQKLSSGSPVWNDAWDLVGLHNAAVARYTDHRGRIVERPGADPWDGENPPANRIPWRANQGVRLASIIRDLQQRVAALDKEKPLSATRFGDLTRTSQLEACFEPPPSVTDPEFMLKLAELIGKGQRQDDPNPDPVPPKPKPPLIIKRPGATLKSTMRAWGAFDRK